MLGETLALAGIVALALGGLATANIAFDKGIDAAFTRRVPGVLGGVAFLMAVLWLSPWTATGVALAVTLGMLIAKLRFRRGLRGVSGSLSPQAWAEITYPLAGAVSLAVGWGLLEDRLLAFLPIAFMAWGDSVSGLTRDVLLRRGTVPRSWPLIGMLLTCLALATLIEPYWIGALGAVVATVSERYSPRINGVRDDNWLTVVGSLGVMVIPSLLLGA